MEQAQLSAALRKKEEIGKKFTSKLRREGLVPGIVYKAGKETLSVTVNQRELEKLLHTSSGANVLIALKIAGAAQPKTVLIKEMQHHPYKDNILHVDFHQIALDEAIKVKVPIATKGEAAGVKAGGILERIMWELEIECLPTQIPEKIEIDVTGLEIGQTKMVKDLIISKGIKIFADPEQIVVSMSAKKAVEEVIAAPEVAPEEPEVIREKKPEAEVEAEKPQEEKKPAKEEKK